MELNKEIFEKDLIKHKKLIARLGNVLKDKKDTTEFTEEESMKLFVPAVRSGKKLALASAGLKCEKTGKTTNLQFHHLIGRPNKKIMPFNRYCTQRHYWANIVVLSQKHHTHNYDEEAVIPDELIAKVKKRYFE